MDLELYIFNIIYNIETIHLKTNCANFRETLGEEQECVFNMTMLGYSLI